MSSASGQPLRVALRPHPAQDPGVLSCLTVEVFAGADGLRLAYQLEGDLAHLKIPSATAAGPADRLWMHTCCEAFIATADAPAYREFNFSPSGQWACYDFADYRTPRQAPAARMDICSRQDASRLILTVHLPRHLLPVEHGEIVLGLSCVVEGRDGTLTYWAITHPADRPDFHHRDGFALRIALPAAPNP